MKVSLAGKVAIVTGAASGIGLAIVQQFLDSEIDGVVAVDIAREIPDVLLQANYGSRLKYVSGDVTLDENSNRFTQMALESFGRIDVLVNNAGINVVKRIHEHTSDEWDRVMNTNVKALFYSAKYVIPESTYLAWIDISCLGLGDNASELLIENQKVAFNPGTEFGAQFGAYIRFNFATSPEIIEEGIKRLAS